MKSSAEGKSQLKVTYDREMDILWIRIPGRKIERTDAIVTPLVIDFGSEEGSEEECQDVVGVEIRKASEYLAPMLEALSEEKVSLGNP